MMQHRNVSGRFEVFWSSLKMAIATFSSRILGLVREQAMAAIFGASGLTDAFLVAYRIPNLLRDLFAEGAFSAAFVPTFTEARAKDPQLARNLLWSLFVLLVLLTSFIGVLIFLFAPELISLFAPSFKADPDKFHSTVMLTRIMSPFLMLISIAALFMGALNSLKIFFIPSFAPAIFNIFAVISIVILPGVFSDRGIPAIYALGVGVLLGGMAQGLIQFPLILKNGYGPKRPEKIFSKQSKKVLKKLGPGLFGFATNQINIMVNTILATGTVVGAVSWLSYAFRLFQFPVGILSVSIAGSNLVHFSEAYKKGDHERAKGVLKESYTLSLFTIVPALMLMYSLAGESIHLVFQRGRFDLTDTMMTAKALKFYILGLPAYGLYKIFVPVFYSLEKERVPVYVSVFTVTLNIIFCITLTPRYGFKVLALGTTFSMILNALIQGILLKSLLDLPISFFFNGRVIKFFIAGLVSWPLVEYLAATWYQWDESLIMRFVTFLIVAGIGGLSYLILLLLLGEGRVVKKLLQKKTAKE